MVAQIGDKKITKQEVLKPLLAQMPDGKVPSMMADQLDNAAPGVIKWFVDQQILEAAAAKALNDVPKDVAPTANTIDNAMSEPTFLAVFFCLDINFLLLLLLFAIHVLQILYG